MEGEQWRRTRESFLGETEAGGLSRERKNKKSELDGCVFGRKREYGRGVM